MRTLAERAFLLCCDAGGNRVVRTDGIDVVVRAAALTDLLQQGLLVDKNANAAPARGRAVSADPVLSAVLNEIGQARALPWSRWVRHGAKQTARAVRQRLVEREVLDVRRRRVLWLIPNDLLTVRDAAAVIQAQAGVRAALRGPAGGIEPGAGALLALVAAAELDFVLDPEQRRDNAERIEWCTRFTGPVAAALHAVVAGRRTDQPAADVAGPWNEEPS